MGYFAEGCNIIYTTTIQELKTIADGIEFCFTNGRDKDLKGFKELINNILSIDKSSSLSCFSNINLQLYRNITKEQIQIIYNTIKKSEKILLLYTLRSIAKNSINEYICDNPYIVKDGHINAINKTRSRSKSSYTDINPDKIKLFKILTKTPSLTENSILKFFHSNDSYNVKNACERYFRDVYGVSELTLYYIYPHNKNNMIEHRFNFSDSVDKFIMAAQDDYLSMDYPRFFDETGKPIDTTKRYSVSVVGGLGLKNKSKIKVLRGVK